MKTIESNEDNLESIGTVNTVEEEFGHQEFKEHDDIITIIEKLKASVTVI